MQLGPMIHDFLASLGINQVELMWGMGGMILGMIMAKGHSRYGGRAYNHMRGYYRRYRGY